MVEIIRTHSKVIPRVLAILAALATMETRLVQAAPAELNEPAARVRLIIDTDGLGSETGATLRTALEAPLGAMLVDDGFELTASSTADVTVRVRSLWLDERLGEFEIHIDLASDAEMAPAIEWFVCKACPVPTVERRILDAFPSALPAVHAAARAEPSGLVSECPEPALDEHEPRLGPPPELVSPPVGPIGLTGLALAGAGLGVTIAGGIELARGRVSSSEGTRERDVIDHRGPGGALFVTGTSVLAVGLLMTAIDLGIRMQKSQPQRNRTTARAPLPVFGDHFLGFVYTGQF